MKFGNSQDQKVLGHDSEAVTIHNKQCSHIIEVPNSDCVALFDRSPTYQA